MVPYRAQRLTDWSDEFENNVNHRLWPLNPTGRFQSEMLDNALHHHHKNLIHESSSGELKLLWRRVKHSTLLRHLVAFPFQYVRPSQPANQNVTTFRHYNSKIHHKHSPLERLGWQTFLFSAHVCATSNNTHCTICPRFQLMEP